MLALHNVFEVRFSEPMRHSGALWVKSSLVSSLLSPIPE